MGLFDKLFNSPQTQVAYAPKNEQEAWVAIMYGCIAVDGDVSDAEIDQLVRTLVLKELFNGHRVIDYYSNALKFHKQIGSRGLIDSSAAKVSAESKATLFALIVELLLADGILAEKEKEIIDYLTNALSLDSELAYRIVEVILIKMKGNVIL